MTKAEISELKKLYKLNNCAVTRICGCYVDGEKNIKAQWQQPFLTMDEEEIFKYMDIFRKCLSGAIGKTLTEVTPAKHKAAALQALRDSKLKDQELLDEFYQDIIDRYEYVGNYLILVIHDVYDVPGRTSDGIEMEDASDEVYEYIVACICPVNLRKPGLSYNPDKQCFTHLNRDWVMSPPQLAVLYPAFNDRSADLEKALYYTKTMDADLQEFAERFLGYTIPLIPKDEKATFNAIIEEVLGYDKSFADVREVAEITEQRLAELMDAAEQKKVGIEDIRYILEESGIKQERVEQLEKVFSECAGKGMEFEPGNLINRRDFTVETADARIKINPDEKYKLSLRYIDKIPCLVLELRETTINVNGIEVNVKHVK